MIKIILWGKGFASVIFSIVKLLTGCVIGRSPLSASSYILSVDNPIIINIEGEYLLGGILCKTST